MRDSVKNTLNISLIFKATIAFALMVVAFSMLSYASIYFYYIRNFFAQIGNANMELGVLSTQTTSVMARASHLEYILYSFAQNISAISQMIALDMKFVICYYMDMLTRVKSAFIVAIDTLKTQIHIIISICKKAISLSTVEEKTTSFCLPYTRLTI